MVRTRTTILLLTFCLPQSTAAQSGPPEDAGMRSGHAADADLKMTIIGTGNFEAAITWLSEFTKI